MLESADTEVVAAGAEAAVAAETPPAEQTYKKGIGMVAWIAIGWLALISLAAILAPVLPLKSPFTQDYVNAGSKFFQNGHLLGSEAITGRDVLSRSIWGAQASLLIGVCSVLLGVLIGGFFGLVAGYVGGKTDSGLSALFNIFLAFPQLVLALTLVSVLAPADQQGGVQWSKRMIVIIISVGIVSIPILGRITRANALAWSQREFVMAAKAQGASDASVMFKEVLPNVLPAMLSIALLGVAIVIVLEGALAIFGLSVPEPSPSWGNMIQLQLTDLSASPPAWQVPCALIFLTVLSLNYLGDVVRAKFDVRESVI